MKNILLFTLLLFSITNICSQTMPSVTVDGEPLKITNLEVESQIVGNIATTTYHMVFFNPNNRVLEGELAFPLGQGQSVTNFAMDVNGKMRDAVIVEKELGRIAYETTIRQTIDPGLLEITKGNNYKARVYPIPANGYKKLSITFEQEMNASNGKHIYKIPFNFDSALDFSCIVKVFNTKQKPKIKQGKRYGLKFNTIEDILETSIKKNNTLVNTSLILEFPIANDEIITLSNDYFNVYKLFKPQTKEKLKPKRISIFWDSSYSMKFRDLETELGLLEKYFDYLKEVTVDYVEFSNRACTTKTFNIKNGNWKALKTEIEAVVYDGGTSFLDLKNEVNNEILLFTDGMFNLGEFQKKIKGNLYAINSVKSSNHDFLKQIADANAGKYINLNITDKKQAFNELKTESFKFLGISKNDDVLEVYPKANTTVKNDFSISGKFLENTDIQLHFGYANKITQTINLTLEKSGYNSLVKRIWAKKKLQFLNSDKENNKESIINLAKKNHLISEYTSLIILDRIEDYVSYEIEPPTELKAEYKERIATKLAENEYKLEKIKEQKNQLYNDYKELIQWYETKYPIAYKRLDSNYLSIASHETEAQQDVENIVTDNQTTSNALVTEESQEQQNQESNRVERNSTLDSNMRIVTGTVVDDDGIPLPGANVVNGNRGAQTDFDGNFSINAEQGDLITVSYLGFTEKQIEVNDSTILNFTLEADKSQLEEVVITGYMAQTRSMAVSSSVVVVEEESVTEGIKTFQGQFAGIQINENASASNTETTITIKGSNSLDKKTPLYVVDGQPVPKRYRKIMPTDSIYSITVLKEEAALSLFGNRALNGVVVITTKTGMNENKEAIDLLNKKIRDNINFKPWSPESDYMKILKAQTTIEEAYKRYLELRSNYRNTPSFFIDVADFFHSKQKKELAVRIVSNLAEIDLDNHEVMRALAYKLEYFEQFELALYVYKEILKLRPEEPQSTRDLALAYENTGNYQKAFDLLYSIIDGQLIEKDLDKRFYGIEHIAYVEACHLFKKHGNEIALNNSQKQIIKPIQVDLRIVADWNHNDTDLDLWIDNPKDQVISYKNKTTDYGDRMSEDMTEGYGPEEYMITKGLKGKYNIEIDYYSDEVQKISGPTILKITIFKNYGSSDETKEVRVFRLNNEEDLLEVGSITF